MNERTIKLLENWWRSSIEAVSEILCVRAEATVKGKRDDNRPV